MSSSFSMGNGILSWQVLGKDHFNFLETNEFKLLLLGKSPAQALAEVEASDPTNVRPSKVYRK